jgi:hypothetical protein
VPTAVPTQVPTQLPLAGASPTLDPRASNVFFTKGFATGPTLNDINTYQNIDRSTWLTTERCSENACVPCDASSNDPSKDGCFTPATSPHHFYQSTAAAGSDLTSAKMTLNLACKPGEKINLGLTARQIQNGEWKCYFNGVEVTSWHYTNRRDYWYVELPASTAPGPLNQVMIVWTRTDSGAASNAAFDFNFKMHQKFIQCEDKKDCLGSAGLGGLWSQDAAKNLRESILLQSKCLNDQVLPADHKTVCARFKSCLSSSGHLPRVRELLEASNAHHAPPLPQFTELIEARDHSADSPTCRNPWLSDPESWDCACHENIVAACAHQPFNSCYRAKLCTSNLVCESWKAASCAGQEYLLELDAFLAGEAAATVGWNCG